MAENCEGSVRINISLYYVSLELSLVRLLSWDVL